MRRERDRIIGALMGLMGAVNNNSGTENTDRVMIKALAYPHLCPDLGEAEANELVGEIHAEKFAVSPGCATCTAPCGNTSDYDMSRIYGAEEDIREIKLGILSSLGETAAHVYTEGKRLSEGDSEFFRRALSLVSYDIDRDALLALSDEVLKHKITGRT